MDRSLRSTTAVVVNRHERYCDFPSVGASSCDVASSADRSGQYPWRGLRMLETTQFLAEMRIKYMSGAHRLQTGLLKGPKEDLKKTTIQDLQALRVLMR